MSFGLLDDNFHDNPKVLGLTHEELRLYVCSWSYNNRHRCAGRIPAAVAQALCRAHGVKPKAIAGLVKKRCWHEREDGYSIHDAQDWDYRRRSEAGRKAARARWGTDATADTSAMRSHPTTHAAPHAPSHSDRNASRVESPTPVPVTDTSGAVVTGTPVPTVLPGATHSGPHGPAAVQAAAEAGGWVGLFVRLSRDIAGTEPSGQLKARVGRECKRLEATVAEDVLSAAVERLVELNRQPNALEAIAGDIARERRGVRPGSRPAVVNPVDARIFGLARGTA